jgi:ubiquinone/menaquinone biosynthesis C-methylase UbiE
MTVSAQEPLDAFRARTLQYLRLGHDRLAAARFVVDSAGEPRGPALDIGTGKGLLAVALARRGLEVVSIDVDASERDLAKLLAEEAGLATSIAFDTGDAARLPYADGRFGCVAMMDVLHHLAEPGPVLREMVRVTAPGGIVVIADFDEEGFALVSRVHRAEGREHPRTSATVSLASKELQRGGVVSMATVRGHQHEVAVLGKPE